MPYDMGVDLDRLLALLEPRPNGFRVFDVEQSRKIGFPIRADRLELNRPRLVDQGLHGRRVDWRADTCRRRWMSRGAKAEQFHKWTPIRQGADARGPPEVLV